MSRHILRAAGLAVVVSIPISHASAHCFVGGRFLPATLIVDDPCVADEVSLPTASWSGTGMIPRRVNRSLLSFPSASPKRSAFLSVRRGCTFVHQEDRASAAGRTSRPLSCRS